MKKLNFIKKIDHLFLFAIILFINFIIIKYFIRSNVTSFLVSFLIAYIIYLILLHLLNKKSQSILIKKQDEQNISLLREYLITCGTKNACLYLNAVFSGQNKENLILSENKNIYVNFDKQTLSLYDFANIYKSLDGYNNKAILAENINDELKNFLPSLNDPVEFIDIQTLYFGYVKDKHPMPVGIINKKNPTKNTFKSLCKVAFTKKTSKGYFFNGIIIFLFSFIYPYQNYYLVYSLFLFLLSLISYFEPFKKTIWLFTTNINVFFSKSRILIYNNLSTYNRNSIALDKFF